MSFLSVGEVQTLTGGTWAQRPHDLNAPVHGLSIDTRTLEQGDAYLAIKGARFDGHAFVPGALRNGASIAIVSDTALHDITQPDAGILRVPDSVRALGRLAKGWRQRLTSVRVVAVTGSNGKTSTVRMIDSVLGHGGSLRGSRALKSFNNEIGVPLTLLRARGADRYLVCEVGMNAPGEIVPLGEICEPDIAVITTAGSAHAGAFEDGEVGVAREKASLLSTVKHDGLAILNGDVDLLTHYHDRVRRTVLFGRTAGCDLRLTEHTTTLGESGGAVRFSVAGSERTFEVAGMGGHTAMNACAAIAVGRAFGLDDHAISHGLLAYEPPQLRLTVERIIDQSSAGAWGVTVFSDCYNASPESVMAALDVLSTVPQEHTRKVVVLGDMLELGHLSDEAHDRIMRVAETSGADLVCVGPQMQRAALRAGVTALWNGDALSDDACNSIADVVLSGDIVLVKGSRAMGLERVVDALRMRYGGVIQESTSTNAHGGNA